MRGPGGAVLWSRQSQGKVQCPSAVRLPRHAVEAPSLEILKTHVDVILHDVLQVILFGWGLGLGDLQRCLPTLAILCWHPIILQNPR